jgi:hypothetical protein
MKRKPTKKEWGEGVTKGFLYEHLNEWGYVFKKEIREEINEDFQKYIDIVMEDNRDTNRMLIEAFENRFEVIEKRLGLLSN